MDKKTLKDVQLNGKTVLLRADFNVPLDDQGNITSDKRIRATLPTIQYILDEKGKLVIFSHLGRIKTEADKKGKSLKPVAERLGELLEQEVIFVPHTRGTELEKAIEALEEGQVLLVENTRFENVDGSKESKNDPELGKYWASLGDIFVNDAFGTMHRKHASNVGIASQLESVVGFLIEKEMKYIGEAINEPERPFVAIIGGAKIGDKIDVIEKLLDKADKILIGGGMAYTFFKARGKEIGQSIVEDDKVEFARKLLERAGDKIVLPKDTVVSAEFSNDATSHVYSGDFPVDMEGMDIGPETIEWFKYILDDSMTVFWNGPMGVFEFDQFANGTREICKAIAKMEGAKTIIGGGDSTTAAEQLGYEEAFTHISTGGGASLAFLGDNELPGLEVIDNKE